MMTPFLQLSFALVIILLTARFAGHLSTRLRQPAVRH
jgi:Kef-type K+ transport system membrane component KefB